MDTAASVLTIDIISDVVCPWCYIGKRRLEQALALRGAGESAPAPTWHAFQLNPEIPAGGIDRRAYLENKFGDLDRTRDIAARIEAAGREVGIAFAFDRIERQPNTLDAHRLIAWAQQVGPKSASSLVERLFSAYFLEGIDIGAPDRLAQLAGEAGYAASEAVQLLASDDGRGAVQQADLRARRLGVSGVPFFIFNQRVGVSGAQPAEVLLDAIRQSTSGD